MSDILDRAKGFARFVHAKQKRKYVNLPYWIHTERVAEMVSRYTKDEDLIAAAYLHDTIEDVDWVTYSVILVCFNYRIADFVQELTNPSKEMKNSTRAERKRVDREHLAVVSKGAKLVKLCDRLDNVRDLSYQRHRIGDDSYASMYLDESAKLLNSLEDVNSELYSHLDSLIKRTKKQMLKEADMEMSKYYSCVLAKASRYSKESKGIVG